MFGYIIYNKAQMKGRDDQLYRSYYCGLCKTLKKHYGHLSRLTLNNDMTFLAILLSGLYEPDDFVSYERCALHPLQKHAVRNNPYITYASDMTVLLSYYKCLDDVRDEHKHRLMARELSKYAEKLTQAYPDITDVIAQELDTIHTLEAEQSDDLDSLCNAFGRILGAIFAYRDDIWHDDLYGVGYHLGQFIYLMDAYDDIDYDIKHHQFNPLMKIHQRDDFDDYCFMILEMFMGQAAESFEILPIIRNREILRNVLYSGVWGRYNDVRTKRQERKKNQEDA